MVKLRSMVQPDRTKLLIINFPHNPTGIYSNFSSIPIQILKYKLDTHTRTSGALITKEEQSEIIKLAQEFDLWLFSDEVYRGSEFDEALTLPPIASVYEKGISLVRVPP